MIDLQTLKALLSTAGTSNVETHQYHRYIYEGSMCSVLKYLRHGAHSTSTKEGFSPIQAVLTFSKWQCSNPLDHIYGLLSLIRWPTSRKITPKYDMSNIALALAMLVSLGNRHRRGDEHLWKAATQGNGSAVKGSICRESGHKDIILQLGPLESVYLVIRKHHGDVYRVVGQALIHPHFDTCPKFKYDECQCRSRKRAARDAIPGNLYVIHFHPQDLLILAAQDNVEDRPTAEAMYFNRVATRPTVKLLSSYVVRRKLRHT
jgi:hypothetical protein